MIQVMARTLVEVNKEAHKTLRITMPQDVWKIAKSFFEEKDARCAKVCQGQEEDVTSYDKQTDRPIMMSLCGNAEREEIVNETVQ